MCYLIAWTVHVRFIDSLSIENSFHHIDTWLQATDLLEGLIPKRDDKGTLPAPYLEKLFLFAIMWSLGALLELEDRAKMEQFIVQGCDSLSLPPLKDDETIFEYLVDEKGISLNQLERRFFIHTLIVLSFYNGIIFSSLG